MAAINIYVGNLPYGTTDLDLTKLFDAYGPVAKATIVTDRETGRSKGFGFIEMTDRDAGQRAISALTGQPFNGRPLTVNEARPRGSGTGDRVLGDGSGGPTRDDADAAAPKDEPVATYAGEAAVTGSMGYRNTLLRR